MELEIKAFLPNGKVIIGLKDLFSRNGTKIVLHDEVEIMDPYKGVVLAGGKQGRLVSSDGGAMGITTVGGRMENEDGIMVTSNMIALADGMGGHDDGEKASKEALRETYNLRNLPIDRVLYDQICLAVALSKIKENSGTTLVMARKSLSKTAGQTVLELGNVGDSKILVVSFTGKKILWESKDQSLVQLLYDTKQISDPLERYTHQHSSVITNAVFGEGLSEDPQIHRMEVPTGSAMVLLCSDGLTDLMTPEEILEIALKERQLCMQTLINRALFKQSSPPFEIPLNGKKYKIERPILDNISIALMML
jgi:protein phosphatase